MNKKLMLCAISLVLIIGVSFESAASSKQQSKKQAPKEKPHFGGTLLFGLTKEPGNPNPFIQTNSTTQFVREASYESLLTRDDDDKIIPHLAETYKVSPDGMSFTLRLHKGVKFHNGKEMRADDVIWSANHVRDERSGAYGNNMIKDVKSVEKMDEYTIKFTLNNPSVTFLSYLASIQMLPIVPAHSLQPGQIKLEPSTFVPGTGAFILEQFQPGFDTVVRKFPEYWNSPAYVDKIVFRPINDGASRFNALRTGDVHMADRLFPLDAMRVKKGEIKGIRIMDEPLGGFQEIIFNYLNPLLQKIEMRRAILFATDKRRLIDEVFFGAALPADLMVDPKSMWARAANLPAHKADPSKVKGLLKAAGYKGQDLVLMGRKSSAQLYEAYQRMLGEAGINIKVELVEAGVARDRATQGKYDLFITGADPSSDPVITMMPYYYTNKVEKGRYSNSKADRLLDSLTTEFVEKKRLQLFKDLAHILNNDVADIPLLFEIRFTGLSEKVQGYGPPPGYSYSESGEYFKRVWLR